MGVFPDGIDNINLKKRRCRKVQYKETRKLKLLKFDEGNSKPFFTTRPIQPKGAKKFRYLKAHENIKVDQVTQKEIQNTTQIF